jgi:tRNA (guanine37-N1)-methyltransferase
MEVIAGLDDLNVEVFESNCKFRFDYGKVYWNSRLQAEHDRIVSHILKRPTAVVADMFAGVGPFSVPLAKSRALVYANDLNPESYKYLVENAKLNKLSAAKHISSNKDGREFVIDLVRFKGIRPTDVIMNLPASATDFLDVFRGLYLDSDTPDQLPTIHCYTFAEEENAETVLIDRIETMIGTKLSEPLIHNVRNIAPKKHMFCVSFHLPTTIERRSDTNDSAADHPPQSKKPKLL